MSRTLVSLLIFFVTAMYIASASDIHLAFAGKVDISDPACVVTGDCGSDETHHAAADPDHCSHGSAHLVGLLSGLSQHSLPESAAIPAAATIYFSVLSSPPTTPPKA